jgi:hypothetical protein
MSSIRYQRIYGTDVTVTLYGKYAIHGLHHQSVVAHTNMVYAIEKCEYNKPALAEGAPPGHWSTWICNDGVYGDQMQTCFCPQCGEYSYLSYQHTSSYYMSPSEPLICQCMRPSYHL